MLKLIIWRVTQFIMDFSMEVPLISLHFSILLTLFIIRLISIGGLYLLGVQLLASVCCVCYAVITTAIIIFLLSLCIRFRSLFTSNLFQVTFHFKSFSSHFLLHLFLISKTLHLIKVKQMIRNTSFFLKLNKY